jgi:hypothetical protein
MRARVHTGVVTGERGINAAHVDHGSREGRRICERVNLRGQKKRNVGIQILLTNREEKKSSGKRKVGSVCARCESESKIGRYVEGRWKAHG